MKRGGGEASFSACMACISVSYIHRAYVPVEREDGDTREHASGVNATVCSVGSVFPLSKVQHVRKGSIGKGGAAALSISSLYGLRHVHRVCVRIYRIHPC